MLPIQVYAKPPYLPYLCVKCGAQDRDWYIDPGIILNAYYGRIVYGGAQSQEHDGSLYLCNFCWEDLVKEGTKAIQMHLHNTMPWENGKEPTYENKEELIHGTVGLPDGPDEESTRYDSDYESVFEGGESNDAETDGDDSSPTSSDPESNHDGDSEEQSELGQFTSFFK